MCGRFALRTSVPELARLLGAEPPLPELAPRYNVAPTDSSVVCVAGAEGARRLVVMRWGLLPHWAKDRSFGARAINARAETVADKPAFRAAFRRRRCLVPVDVYYEWRAARPVKQPYFVHLDGDYFASYRVVFRRCSFWAGCDVAGSSNYENKCSELSD